MAVFKCPQCVAASLTSYVGFVNPIKNTENKLYYFDPNGDFHLDNGLGNKIIYMCTQNHFGIITNTQGI